MNYKLFLILSMILLILLFIFIGQRLYNNTIDYVIILISLFVLLFTFVIHSNKKIFENFENLENIDNVDSSSLYRDNENIDEISKDLVIYLTSYSNKSYTSGLVWNNIAPNKTNENNKFTFLNEPIITSTGELLLQSNQIKGPYSMNLNIDMKKDFTIFINIRLSPFTNNQNLLKIFEIYATKDNIGIYLHVIKDDNGDSFILLKSGFTSDIYYKISSQSFNLYDNQYHLITIVKNSEYLRLYIDKNINENDLPVEKSISVFDNTFSNAITTILDNTDNNIMTYISHFGVYNKELKINNDINEIILLYNFIQNTMMKQSNIYKNLLTEYNSYKSDITLSKENPFINTAIKSKCTMVTDWSSYNNVILEADNDCLKSINDYCKSDNMHEQCKIWKNFSKVIPYFMNTNTNTNSSTINNSTNSYSSNLTEEEKKKILNNTYFP
jgi:hypothetical protein